ncbi:MAG: carboxy terminal-processing peptidase [Verrucomicrobiales bacterium]
MMNRPVSKAFLGAAVAVASLSHPACSTAETNYGQVAMFVANMLVNHHYTRKEFDDSVSEQLLNNYLKYLDYNRMYFTQADIDRYTRKYARTLDDKILLGDIGAAKEIYDDYFERVKMRMDWIKTKLNDPSMKFDSDRTVEISRKDSAWPKNDEEADQLWNHLIESELLQEQLRRHSREMRMKEKAEKEAAEGKKDEGEKKEAAADEDKESPAEVVSKRYERFFQQLEQNEEEDVNNYFLSSLAMAYDPHSEYFSHSEQENFFQQMDHQLFGIGALLQMEDGAAEIKGIVVGGPADQGGELRIKDRIIGVGQGKGGEIEDVMYMKLSKVVEKIRGKKGTIVRLKVVPASSDGAETKIISIIRDEINLKDGLANAELLKMDGNDGKEHRIGWINLESFYADMEGGSTSTTADIRRLLQRLMKEGMEGLVLDLRGNGGGSLDEAINLTGLFIPSGPVVQAKDWRGHIDSRSSRSPEPMYSGPMIVLTDRVSASASEILAAALQDYGRAVVVGDKSTFGKGTVQTILPVERYMPFFADKRRAGALKVTIQKFYRIAGTTTQLQGVIPDIILPSRRDATEIGEEALDNPLPHDTIPPMRYGKWIEPLPIADLLEKSAGRVAKDKEFQWIQEDTKRLKELYDNNEISLNLNERIAEQDKLRNDRKERNAERKAMIEEFRKEGMDDIQIYKLTLDNVDDEKLVAAADVSEEDQTGMRVAKDEDDDADLDEPDFPFGLDPVKMEALHIMQDFIGASGSHTAKVEPKKDASSDKVPQ